MAKKRYYMSKSKGAKKASTMMPSSDGSFARMFQGSFMKTVPKCPYITTSMYPSPLSIIDSENAKFVAKAQKNAAKTKF